ncbi:hypothetical protein [Rhodanobacter lindaniclasticus]
MQQLVAGGVDLDQLGCVLDVVVDVAGAVGYGELRLAGQRDGGDHRAFRGVDHAGRVTAAIERQHVMRGFVVNDGIGLLAGADDGRQRLEHAQIELGDRGVRAIAGEAAPQVVGDRDAVHAGGVGQRGNLPVADRHRSPARDRRG